MRQWFWFFWLLGVFSLSVFAEETSQPRGDWPKKMKALEQSLGELLTDINNEKKFKSPQTFVRVRRNVEKISKLAHDLEKIPNPPDRDPSLPIISHLFSEQMKHTQNVLKSGPSAYGKALIQSAAHYCMACHTRNGSGPSFKTLDLKSQAWANSLSGIEKANYLTSIRQFDSALQEYEKLVFNTKNAEKFPFDWENAVRFSIAIAVRVQKDATRAIGVADQVISNSSAPLFLKRQAQQWKKDLLDWKNEPGTHPQTEEGYYAAAIKLLAQAKVQQQYPADRSADILYLRASSLVHELMSFAPNGKRSADAFFLAGLSYEVLSGLHLWNLHEYYFLACIYKAPHSALAEKCFQHYEESVYLGYTGSAGTELPSEVKGRLNKLHALAQVQESKKPL